MDESKAFIAVTSLSNCTKSYETILNCCSWPQRGEEQDVLNQINNKDENTVFCPASIHFCEHK